MNNESAVDPSLSVKQTATIVLVIGLGLAVLGWFAYSLFQPPPPQEDIAGGAERYLRFRKSTPLSEPLEKIVTDKDTYFKETEEHPLLGQPAPEIRLRDHLGKLVTLKMLSEKGPVVAVFYYGYWCDHCVAQLFGLEEDLGKFAELDATIVAISADSAEHTQEKFDRYGAFSFPVLSDPDHKVAETYGVYKPASEDAHEQDLHGTFLIDREGVVRWVDTGDQPFIHNQTLLYELCKMEGRLPDSDASKPVEVGSTKE